MPLYFPLLKPASAVEILAHRMFFSLVFVGLIIASPALTLACSFAGYGLLKKKINAGAVETLAVETSVLAVPALVTLHLTPILQFTVGVGLRHEPLPPARLLGFCLVWLALTVLVVDGLRRGRQAGELPVVTGSGEPVDVSFRREPDPDRRSTQTP